MLISHCYVKFNCLNIKTEFKGGNKSKVFTVTISVSSVKVKKQVHNDMSNHMFLFCFIHFELNTI